MSSELEIVEEETLLLLKYVASGSLLCLSALFAGLTLGLLGLDKISLEIVMKCGDKKDSANAKKIMPLRSKGHLLLCTLLLGNVMTNSLLSIVLADATSGFVGFLLSTALITTFGEIFPQAICSKYALAIGARTVWVVKIFMFLLLPVAWPMSLLLDKLLGEDNGQIYTKTQLKELFNIHVRHTEESGLCESDSQLLKNTIDLSFKSVKNGMKAIGRIFSLEISEVLNPATLALIGRSGCDSIPIYKQTKENIIGSIFAKDFLTVDTQEGITVQNLFERCGHSVIRVSSDTKLDSLLSQFKTTCTHIAIVEKQNPKNENENNIFETKITILKTGPQPSGFGHEEAELQPFFNSEPNFSTQNPNLISTQNENENEIFEDLNGILGVITLNDIYEQMVKDAFVASAPQLSSDFSAHSDFPETKINFTRGEFPEPETQPSAPASASASGIFGDQKDLNSASSLKNIVLFLTQFVEPFKRENMSVEMAEKIVESAQVIDLKPDPESDVFIYKRGTQCDSFTLILSGKIEVTFGEDNFVSILGVWDYIGTQALTCPNNNNQGIDFTARVVRQPCRILKITRDLVTKTKESSNSPMAERAEINSEIQPGEMMEFAALRQSKKIPILPPPIRSDPPQFSLLDQPTNQIATFFTNQGGGGSHLKSAPAEDTIMPLEPCMDFLAQFQDAEISVKTA